MGNFRFPHSKEICFWMKPLNSVFVCLFVCFILFCFYVKSQAFKSWQVFFFFFLFNTVRVNLNTLMCSQICVAGSQSKVLPLKCFLLPHSFIIISWLLNILCLAFKIFLINLNCHIVCFYFLMNLEILQSYLLCPV